MKIDRRNYVIGGKILTIGFDSHEESHLGHKIKYVKEELNNDKYHNPKTGLQTYFLTFEDNTRLEIMTRLDMISSEKSLMQTGYIHLAFTVGSKEKVDKLTSELDKLAIKY
jgi:hypothetical protein